MYKRQVSAAVYVVVCDTGDSMSAAVYVVVCDTGDSMSVAVCVVVCDTGDSVSAAVCVVVCDTGDSVSAAVTLLESFCNCRTVLNSNATRCTRLFKLQYDRSSRKLTGMAVEVI